MPVDSTLADPTAEPNTWKATVLDPWVADVSGTIATLEAGGGVRVPASSFGFTTSGDNTAAFTALDTALGSAPVWVVFPAGTFAVANGFQFTTGRQSLTIEGAGMGRTVFNLGASSSGRLLGAFGSSDITLRDLTLDGNRANQSAERSALEFAQSTNLQFQRVQFTDTKGRGAYLWRCQDFTFEGCIFSAIGDTPSGFLAQAGLLIHGNDSGGNGAYIGGRVLNCLFDGFEDVGTLIGDQGNWGMVYIGNRFRDGRNIGLGTGTGNFDITIADTWGEDIAGNLIDTGACWGVTVTNTTGARCESGIIADGAATGAYAQQWIGGSFRDMRTPDGRTSEYLSGGSVLGLQGGTSGGKSGWVVSGFTVDGSAGPALAFNSVADAALTDIIIRNAKKVTHAGITGTGAVDIFSDNTRLSDNIQIRNVTVIDDQGSPTIDYALRVYGAFASNVLVEDCTFLEANPNTAMVGLLNGATSAMVTVRNTRGYVQPGDVLVGSGSPESAVTAPIGTLYVSTAGGSNTTLYAKESGSGNTGWQPR